MWRLLARRTLWVLHRPRWASVYFLFVGLVLAFWWAATNVLPVGTALAVAVVFAGVTAEAFAVVVATLVQFPVLWTAGHRTDRRLLLATGPQGQMALLMARRRHGPDGPFWFGHDFVSTGNGFGAHLLNHFVTWARQGGHTVEITTAHAKLVARYQQAGFTVVGRRFPANTVMRYRDRKRPAPCRCPRRRPPRGRARAGLSGRHTLQK
ncbi:hypothetical protein GCM10010123_02220 [Pilimelia anulata]|uniref:N-acetyltransferase domain-containing protein n=2 Tax=Pilimelia anulata TaxID=53371 RepID=A0A8J3B6D2_9ACTN|nr:hypothetical protein GCM10010123_02220 [Pilimelia anulata]